MVKAKKQKEKIEKGEEEKGKQGEAAGEAAEEKKGKKKAEGDLQELPSKHKQLLVPLDEYVKNAVHLGTKVIMPDMRRYVYRRRADGLAILNTDMIDEQLRKACALLSKYDPKDVVVACKRESGWKAAQLFSSVTGIRIFTKKYPAGIITNPALKDFFEPSLVIVCDPWLDKNALHDAAITKLPVIGLCDSNNLVRDITLVVPCNNKSEKSLGLIFFVFAREYCKTRGLPFKQKLEQYTGEEK